MPKEVDESKLNYNRFPGERVTATDDIVKVGGKTFHLRLRSRSGGGGRKFYRAGQAYFRHQLSGHRQVVAGSDPSHAPSGQWAHHQYRFDSRDRSVAVCGTLCSQ